MIFFGADLELRTNEADLKSIATEPDRNGSVVPNNIKIRTHSGESWLVPFD
jgi:hypothetical protein